MDTARTRREHEVWQACDDLWALNANLGALKGDEIREQLLKLGYKKGSPNEIYKYRQTWKESRGISEKALIEAGQQTDPISRAVSLVYEQIQQEAAKKITAIQTDSNTQLESLTAQNRDLIQTCEATLQKYESLEAEHEGLKIAHETLREALTDSQTQNRELTLRLTGCEVLLSELKSTYTAQIDKLEQKLKDQGFALSEEAQQAKLGARSERDLRIKAEDQITQLVKELERQQKRLDTYTSKALQKEFEKLASLVKKIKIPKPLKKASRKKRDDSQPSAN